MWLSKGFFFFNFPFCYFIVSVKKPHRFLYVDPVTLLNSFLTSGSFWVESLGIWVSWYWVYIRGHLVHLRPRLGTGYFCKIPWDPFTGKWYYKNAILRLNLVIQWLRFRGRECKFSPWPRSHMPHSQKTPNIKQRQRCNKFNEDF